MATMAATGTTGTREGKELRSQERSFSVNANHRPAKLPLRGGVMSVD